MSHPPKKEVPFGSVDLFVGTSAEHQSVNVARRFARCLRTLLVFTARFFDMVSTA
jgi:hypothetical protein